MKKLILITSVLAISACASAPKQSSAQKSYSSSKMAEAVSSSSDTCQTLYTNYDATMAQFKPKKKSFLKSALGAAAGAGGLVSSQMIGSGVDPRTILKVNDGVNVVKAINAADNIDTLNKATSAVSATRQAYSIAQAEGCDTKVLNTIAEKNSK